MVNGDHQCVQYEVEVSGHDEYGGYFAQSALLRWNQDTGKILHVNRKLHPGTTIFLRLPSWHGGNGLPLPYRVSRLVVVALNTWDAYLTPLETKESEERLSPITPGRNWAR